MQHANRIGQRFRFAQQLCAASTLLLALAAGGAAQTARPVISKIDPPNWFTGLPDSMLLVHGEHLENTLFALHHTAARISATTISANGHWAFLTLQTGTAHAGTAELIASNMHGSTAARYVFTARRGAAQQPQGFSSKDVMYLIMPDRFADGDVSNDTLPGFRVADDRSAGRAYHGGDLRGIEQHLDYLRQLGVTTIWTTPLYDNSAAQSGQTYHGYSATDMYAVDPHLGTMADYQSLVRAAHARGMKVVLDTVPNHVGPSHPWAKDEPTPDWFHGTPASHINVDDDFASITDKNAPASRRHVLLDGWFADVLPDMDQEQPLVAQYLLQNAVWWIEMAGIDGLRIDTFPYVPRSFWHDYNAELHRLYPRLKDVGEVFNKDANITSFFAGGRANTGSDGTFDTLLDTPFDFPMYFALRGALTHHQAMSTIADVLRQDTLYPHPERLVTFLGNHDTARFLSVPGADAAALHLAYGLLATLRGMPQLYYGDEIEMTGGDDPDNRQDFPGGFPGDTRNAFTAAGRDAQQQAMYAWVQSLLQLRAKTPALQTGSTQILLADKNSLAFMRAEESQGSCAAATKDSRLLIVVNNDMAPADVVVPLNAMLADCKHFQPLLREGAPVTASAGALRVHLSSQDIGIFEALP